MIFKQNEENLFSIFALKNYYYGKKITVTIEVEDGSTWTFTGTIKYTTERLATCQIMKQYLKKLFKRDNDASFREIKELLPIKNKIERMEKELRKKHVSSMRVPCPARAMPCGAVEYKRFPTNPLKQKNALFYVLLTKVRSPPVQKCYFTVYQCTIRFQAYQIRLFPDYTVIIFAPDKRKRYEKTLSPQQVTPLCATFSHEQ